MDEVRVELIQYMINGKYIYIQAKYLLDNVPNVLDYRVHKDKPFYVDISVYGKDKGRYEAWINSAGCLKLTKFFNNLRKNNESVKEGDVAVIKTIKKYKKYNIDILKPT